MTAATYYSVRWTLDAEPLVRAAVLAQLNNLPQPQRPDVIRMSPQLVVVSPDDSYAVRRIMTDAGAACARER